MFEQFHLEVIATTDAATDDLKWHKMIRESGWKGRVVPTYRPDAVVDLDKADLWPISASSRTSPAAIRANGSAISMRIASAASSSSRWARRPPITVIRARYRRSAGRPSGGLVRQGSRRQGRRHRPRAVPRADADLEMARMSVRRRADDAASIPVRRAQPFARDVHAARPRTRASISRVPHRLCKRVETAARQFGDGERREIIYASSSIPSTRPSTRRELQRLLAGVLISGASARPPWWFLRQSRRG